MERFANKVPTLCFVVSTTNQYKNIMQPLLVAAVFLLPLLGRPAEVEAGFLSSAAKMLTRFKMRLDARLDPNRDNDVVSKTNSYSGFAL